MIEKHVFRKPRPTAAPREINDSALSNAAEQHPNGALKWQTGAGVLDSTRGESASGMGAVACTASGLGELAALVASARNAAAEFARVISYSLCAELWARAQKPE